jgi:hypothetical protein
MQLSRWTLALLSAVLAVVLTAACGKTISEAIDDTTITTRVKTALLNDPNVGGLRIDVDTFRSVVTLTGRVKSQAERDHAVTLTRRVSGVSEVKDALQIVPDAPAASSAPPSDAPSVTPSATPPATPSATPSATPAAR